MKIFIEFVVRDGTFSFEDLPPENSHMEINKVLDQYIKRECIKVEFDSETMKGRVIPVKEWR